jgi:hypothetical protein
LSFETFDALYRFSDGLPIHLIPTVENFDKANPVGSFGTVDPHARTPYTQYFSFNIQRALPGDMVWDIGYVSTRGTKLPGEIDGNPTLPGDPTTTNERRRYAATIPGVTSIEWSVNAFSSNYHSLQTKLEKRMSAGLQFLLTYTFSKSIDNKSGSSVTGGGDSDAFSTPHNPFDIDSDRGPSAFDRKHRFIAAFNYDLPFGRGKPFGVAWGSALDAILGGWKVNGIVNLQSGLPFNVYATSDFNCGCTVSEPRPDRIGDGRLPASERSVQRWFDGSAFQNPPNSTAEVPGRYGNAGRNIIPGPDFKKVDFSLFKTFKIKEQMKLQFRAEFFNLFNRASFEFPQPGDATFVASGILTRAFDARIAQLALKLEF